MDSYEMPKDSEVAKSLLSAGQRYAAEVRRLGKGHGLGAPDPYKTRALLEELAKRPTDNKYDDASKQKVALLAKLFNDLNLQELHIMFKVCKVDDLYDSSKQRLRLATAAPAEVRLAISRAMEHAGCTGYLGSAPADGLERVLQEQLQR